MSSLAADTSDEVQALLDERWLKMSSAAKADVVTALCGDCTALALAGTAAQYGEIDPEETATQVELGYLFHRARSDVAAGG